MAPAVLKRLSKLLRLAYRNKTLLESQAALRQALRLLPDKHPARVFVNVALSATSHKDRDDEIRNAVQILFPKTQRQRPLSTPSSPSPGYNSSPTPPPSVPMDGTPGTWTPLGWTKVTELRWVKYVDGTMLSVTANGQAGGTGWRVGDVGILYGTRYAAMQAAEDAYQINQPGEWERRVRKATGG